MDFLELSQSRYSVLHYQNKPIPDELLNKIVDAGISAPTACNFQPQKIKLINSDADKEKLNRVVPSKYYVPAAFLVCYDKSISNNWNYYVQDGPYTPQYVYGEKQMVSAIMSISGMSLYGNTVRYHIHQR